MMVHAPIDVEASVHRERLACRLRTVLAEHLDPEGGSDFWRTRAAKCGIGSSDEIDDIGDLHRLGSMTADDLRGRPLMDFIPRRYHDARTGLVIGQTGGTTGSGTWTAFLPDEFQAAFVDPFTVAARHVGFPERATWLFVGPGGPHIIGQAARAIARSVGSAEPFTVDFDPRWYRRLPAGSMGAQAYLHHVVEQAMDVISGQPIDVLFATPPVLLRLAETMSPPQRHRVRGVHYGGMAIDAETLVRLREAFPEAVHLSGYGNTLFGCCPQLEPAGGNALEYYPHGDRLLLEVVDEHGAPAATGRVRATRLDRSMLIVRMLERDVAERIGSPVNGAEGFTGAGLRNPRPLISTTPRYAGGLY